MTSRPGPVSEADRAKLERDKMRQREQERRRREAQVGQITISWLEKNFRNKKGCRIVKPR